MQVSTFIEQLVEDESQMEALLQDCSRIVVWNIYLASSNPSYPSKWFTKNSLDVIMPLVWSCSCEGSLFGMVKAVQFCVFIFFHDMFRCHVEIMWLFIYFDIQLLWKFLRLASRIYREASLNPSQRLLGSYTPKHLQEFISCLPAIGLCDGIFLATRTCFKSTPTAGKSISHAIQDGKHQLFSWCQMPLIW